MSDKDIVRLLVPDQLARYLSRRLFLRRVGLGAATLGLGGFAAACGGDDDDGGDDGTATSAAGSDGSSAGALEGSLSVYSWAEYSDPVNFDSFTSEFGPSIALDNYDSNEAMIAKLELAGGSAGYDIVVPTSGFLSQMVDKGLLMELDMSKIPNAANQDQAIVDLKNAPTHDPEGKYAVVKDWGSTGYLYDTAVIEEDLVGWSDFFRAATLSNVTGLVSVLEAPGDVTGMVFWRDGIDWNTTDPADLQHAEDVLLNELAPHIKAFTSYPVAEMISGDYVLAQMWNGDARRARIDSGDPDRYRWVLGSPKTELWVDTWTVLESAPNPDAAHAFINHMLDAEVSAVEVNWHGYNTAVGGVDEILGAELELPEMIFFSDEEKAQLVPGNLTEAQDRLVEIYNKLQAATGQA